MVKLEISLKRVQTFIFDVPRLKAMLGANALVGQTMRHELPKLLGIRGLSLPWPPSVTLATIPVDPLSQVTRVKPGDIDDPKELYARGILARDGGHFIAVFKNDSDAEMFRGEVEEQLADLLPGVLFDADIKPFPDAKKDGRTFKCRDVQETHLLDLPVLQVCQETGQEPASRNFQDDTGNRRWRARSVTHRLGWGRKFRYGGTSDIIGLLRSKLYPPGKGSAPDDLAQLAAGGYLALIHADGNGIGMRYNEWKKKATLVGDVDKEAHGEAFFHSMRVAVRRAVVDALAATFTDTGGKRPYEVLMLGGDDLLLACRADKALDFAQYYATELAKHSLADGNPLTVAIGVAIAKKTYPLHRLHELAESLAGSAKRLYRSPAGENKTSVIDWQVVTQSWFDGVAEARRQSDLIQYRLNAKKETAILTGRPYRVLGNDGLAGLLTAAKQLDSGPEKTARSPLRSLRTACEQGRLSGEMAFTRLPKSVQDQLAWASGGDLWKPLNGQEGNSFYLTRALDIIGIREISRLGNKQS